MKIIVYCIVYNISWLVSVNAVVRALYTSAS